VGRPGRCRPGRLDHRRKLRWLADHEAAHADATAAVCLPHDWLGWRPSCTADIGTLHTDRSDASGTAISPLRTAPITPIS
jgi:xylulokinase